METVSPELRLLLACSQAAAVRVDDAHIREVLGLGVDWTRFARMATGHGLAALAGHALMRVAPDLVPEDVLDALRISTERARFKNQALFKDLVGLNKVLAKNGIEAISIGGPVLTVQAFRDLGVEGIGGLDVLVRNCDAAVSKSLFNMRSGDGARRSVHTRLAPVEMVLNINPSAFWDRARCVVLDGHSLLTLAPEDHLIVLATHGCQERWRSIRRLSYFAALIGSQPEIDWGAMLALSRAQGYLRMLLLAASLARQYLGSDLPDIVIATAGTYPVVLSMARRMATQWDADTGPRRSGNFSMDVLRLHNGRARQGRYLARALLWQRRSLEVSLARALFGLAKNTARKFAIPELRQTYRSVRMLIAPKHAAADAIDGGGAGLGSSIDAPEVSAWITQARTLFNLHRFAEAAEASENALKKDPTNRPAMRLGIDSRLKSCDWRRLQEDRQWIADCIMEQPAALGSLPFFIECFGFGNAEVWRLNHDPHFVQSHKAPPNRLLGVGPYYHDKIRVAYISSNFQDPMAHAVVGVLECHDKRRFDVTAVSLGPDKRSALRQRLEVASDRFIEARNLSEVEIAAILRDLEVDIAIDLYTVARDTRIFAARPAPVQVNYPGYPGTLGVPYIDYIIADPIVIPEEHRSYYSENVVYMPHSYFPSDRKRLIAESTPSRHAEGLPESGFVFACFNATYKITPAIFDIWMRLLHDVKNSVLWLREDNLSSVLNLRRETRIRGIDPERVVFAQRVQLAKHLARQKLADLFLDTLPINAQATASDALWAGLPVLTCRGDIFSARVASSLLQALGMPELVTSSLAEYEQLARMLAHSPSRLAAIRAKLAQHRETAPLFDTARYTRDLESAFTIMWKRSEAGFPPTCFAMGAALPDHL